MNRRLKLLALAVWAWVASGIASPAAAQMLDEELRSVPAAELAAQAKADGDPTRGAILFFQPHMACAKCHSVGGGTPSTLGPDLATLGREVHDEALVEAVLLPSKTIRKGFESVTAVTVDGRSVSGLLVERTPQKLVLRDVTRNGESITLPAAEIEDVRDNPQSIMPAGQMNQLTSRQQFLDLIRYLMEIRDGGADRARELQPPVTLLISSLPEYEDRLDHAGLIGDWDQESLQRARRSIGGRARTVTARKISRGRCRPRCGSPRADSRTAAIRWRCIRR
jgi:putative heme-binding domain-containing protein